MKKLIILAIIILSTMVSAKEAIKAQDFSLIVNESGFVPSSLKVKAHTPVNLKVTRKTDSTCAHTLIIPSKKIKVELPLNKEVVINVGKLEKGEIKFGCDMDMMINAVLIAE